MRGDKKTTDVATRCPECGSALTHRTDGTVPWCPECEWNLLRFDGGKYRPHGWIARRSHRAATRLDAAMFAEVAGRRPARPRATTVGVVLAVVSIALFALDLALLVWGLWLIATAFVLAKLFGVVLILVAIELRPRLSRLGKHDTPLRRDDAPNLFAFVDWAAARLNTRSVDLIVLSDDFNAWTQVVGLRRRRVLGLGLPLWCALSDHGRAALLGHELGHFVNGDPTRSLLAQPADMTFHRLANLFHPGHRGFGGVSAGLVGIAEMLAQVLVLRPLSFLFGLADLGVSTLSARSQMRAEYYADSLAFELGGAEGVQELTHHLLLERTVRSALHSASHRTKDASQWRDSAASAIRVGRDRVRWLEQSSIRYDASLFSSHPPSGLRLRAARAWQERDPAPAPDVPTVVTDRTVETEMRRVARDLSLT